MSAFKRVEESQINMSLLMTPSHSNFSGKIHGGYILNLMDQVAFSCASKHSGFYCVTASVNRVDFLNPVDVGELLHLRASINYTGNTSMVVGLRVEAEDIRTGKIKHCNSSYFTMVAKDDDGRSMKIPGLILETKESIRRFARSLERQRHTSMREKNFEPEGFEIEKYIDSLKTHNVKVTFNKKS